MIEYHYRYPFLSIALLCVPALFCDAARRRIHRYVAGLSWVRSSRAKIACVVVVATTPSRRPVSSGSIISTLEHREKLSQKEHSALSCRRNKLPTSQYRQVSICCPGAGKSKREVKQVHDCVSLKGEGGLQSHFRRRDPGCCFFNSSFHESQHIFTHCTLQEINLILKLFRRFLSLGGLKSENEQGNETAARFCLWGQSPLFLLLTWACLCLPHGKKKELGRCKEGRHRNPSNDEP